MNKIHDSIADNLVELGGHLECNVCGLQHPLADIAGYLKYGWPKHHNYTMTWITASQESLAAPPIENSKEPK